MRLFFSLLKLLSSKKQHDVSRGVYSYGIRVSAFSLSSFSLFLISSLVASASTVLADDPDNPPVATSEGVLDAIVDNIVDSASNYPLLFSIFAYLFGLFFIVSGLFRLRRHIDNPNSESIASGLWRVFGGGALMAGPTVVRAVMNFLSPGIVGGTGVPPSLPEGVGGIGVVILNVAESFKSPESLFAFIAYGFGIGFALWAIVEFIKAGENSNQVPLRKPIMITVTASALLALPNILQALKVGVFNFAPPIGGTDVDPVTGTPGGTALDQILVNVVSHLYAPMLYLLEHVSWIAGIALAMVAIFRLLKSMQEGPKAPVGMGTVATFLAAAALMNLPQFMGVAQESLFGSTNVSNFSVLATGGDAAVLARANQAISAVFLFVRIVGYISFVRGIFILRAFADGGGQATMAAGLTHIIGGAVAINLAAFVSAVQDTLGLNIVAVN